MSPLDADLDQFVARLRARLVVGAKTYGDSSFRRPVVDLIDEVQGELEGVTGWGLLLWVRTQRLRERVDAAQLQGGTDGL